MLLKGLFFQNRILKKKNPNSSYIWSLLLGLDLCTVFHGVQAISFGNWSWLHAWVLAFFSPPLQGKVFCHSWQNSVCSVPNWSLTSFLENLFQCSTMLDILHTEMAFQSFTVGHICSNHHSCDLTQFFLWLPPFLKYNVPSGYTAPMKGWPIINKKQAACIMSFAGKTSSTPAPYLPCT